MPCSVLETSRLIGKKWTLPIVEEIAINGFDGFNRFVERIDGITPTTLSHEIKELESAHIIQKVHSLNTSDSTSYTLTEKGAEFYRLLDSIKLWNVKWNNIPDTCLNSSCFDCERFLRKEIMGDRIVYNYPAKDGS